MGNTGKLGRTGQLSKTGKLGNTARLDKTSRLDKAKMTGNTNKQNKIMKHSRRGIRSCQQAVLVFVLIVSMFNVSYILKGNIGRIWGFLGIASIVISIWGLKNGVVGLKDKNRRTMTCKVGIVLNALWIILFVTIFFRGLLL
jgi:hypothetical protein